MSVSMKVKTSIALDEEVHEQLKKMANEQRRSLSSLLDYEISKVIESRLRKLDSLVPETVEVQQ
jgi:predicted transcriptional regulator